MSKLHADHELDSWVVREEGRSLTKEGLTMLSQNPYSSGKQGLTYLDDVLPNESLRHDIHEITTEFHNPNRKDSANGSWDPRVSDVYHGAQGGK